MRKVIALLLVGIFAFSASAFADSAGEITGTFTATDGKTLYEQNCQGCHMPGGAGAHGAGMYPALANNIKLSTPLYPAMIINNGLHGMPAFSPDFTDEQVAAIANYVSTNFGNKSETKITAEDAKSTRPSTPVMYQD